MTADEFDEYARKLGSKGAIGASDQAPAGDQYDAYAKKLGAGESVTSDVVKSVAMAPPKAALGIAGMPGTMREVGDMLQRKASEYAPDWLKKATAAGNVVSRFADPIAAMLPSAHKMQTAAEGVTGEWYQPKTWQGKAADTGVQTALTMGRNWITNPAMTGAMTAAVTGGTEAARHLSDENPWWMMAGGLLGGMPVAARNALKTRQGVVVRDALGKLPEDDIAAGLVAQERARAQGVPLMGTEALDRGHGLASAVRASLTGSPIIDAFLNKRPEQVSAAVKRDILGPTQSSATPQEAARRGQSAADQVISDAEQFRTNQTRPYYEAAKNDRVPFQSYKNIVDAINGARAHMPAQQSTFDNYLAQIADPTASSAAGMDSLYRTARDAGSLNINATSADKAAAAAHNAVKPSLEAASASPNIVQGRQLYGDITRSVVEPRTSGPVGVVAGRTGFDASAPSSWPRVSSVLSNADSFKAKDVRSLASELSTVDNKAFPDMAHAWINNELDSAVGSLRSGPNPTAGAKFFDAVAGTPDKAAKFDATMRGVAQAHGQDPQAVVSGARNLLKTLDLTGRTPGIGSATQPRMEIAKELSKTVTGDIGASISSSPLRPLTQRLDDMIMRGRYEDIAKALTAKDSVQLLVKMAKLKPNGITASYYAAALLGLDRVNGYGQ